MDPVQALLVLAGVAVAAGGVAMLVNMARREDSTPRPYAPLGMVAVGGFVAYRAFTTFRSMDAQDITIMFLFVFALLSLLGLQFFVANKQS
ncbi:MAG TPA: hypothetical protein VM409_07580 [Chloroflexia bacterium]|nr:hypothetical protein [Chloroflexia bacterium]